MSGTNPTGEPLRPADSGKTTDTDAVQTYARQTDTGQRDRVLGTQPDGRSAAELADAVQAGAVQADEVRADAELADALDQLSRVTVGAQSLQASLEWIARLAVLAVPDAEGTGVTMLEGGHAETVFVSDLFVQDIETIQYGLGEGPCITAAREVRTVMSGSLGTDRSWPRFGPRVRDLGVNSALSLPLVMPGGEVMGALNIYAHPTDAFSADAAERGTVFAAAAAVAVHSARALMQAARLTDQLHIALKSRATIDQAIGILLTRHSGTPDDAFATLKRLSQNQNVKLSAVAENIVREAMARARARRRDT